MDIYNIKHAAVIVTFHVTAENNGSQINHIGA
jgi:hypothetical protein